MGDTEKSNFNPTKWRQFLAAAISSQGAFILGSCLAWSSPALPSLAESQEVGLLTIDQLTWTASLTILGAVVSPLPGGYSVGKMGRRKTILLLCIPLFFGWLQIIFADSLRMIYFGRFIIGAFAGAFSLAVPVYIGEISEDRYRGQLGSFFTLQLVTGILITYIIGSFLNWRLLSAVLAIFPISLFISMYFMPESPIFLLSIGQDQEAGQALTWLRGATEPRQLEPELKMMKSHTSNTEQVKLKLRDWFQGPIIKPLIICVILMIVQQWSGIGIAIIYTVQIFKSAGSTLSPNISTILVGIAQVIGVTLSTFLVDRVGRRVLLMTSCLSVILCFGPLGFFYYMKENNLIINGITSDSLGLLPLISLVAFMVVFSIGLGPIPWILPGELMAPNVRAMTAAIATTLNWLVAFILSKIFDDVAASMGVYFCYWIFCGICLFGALFVYFFLPETKQKSYEDIYLHFNSQSISSRL